MREVVLILYNVRSVHNVGSIFRTADAAGVKKIYLCGITPSPLDRFGHIRADFHKVALGAERSVAWEARSSVSGIFRELKEGGYKIFAIEQHKNSIPYKKLKVGGNKLKVALVFGNEVRGIPKSVLNKCDKILEIPMRGKIIRHISHPRRAKRRGATRGVRHKESLNVAVACGVVLFELINH